MQIKTNSRLSNAVERRTLTDEKNITRHSNPITSKTGNLDASGHFVSSSSPFFLFQYNSLLHVSNMNFEASECVSIDFVNLYAFWEILLVFDYIITDQKEPGSFLQLRFARSLVVLIPASPGPESFIWYVLPLRDRVATNVPCKRHRIIQTIAVRKRMPPSNNWPVLPQENEIACLSSNKMSSRSPLLPPRLLGLDNQKKRVQSVLFH